MPFGHPLRFAVLCRDARLERWQLRSVRRLLELEGAMLSAVLMQGSAIARPVRRMERRNRSWMYRFVGGKPRPSGQRYRERLPQQFASLPIVQVDGNPPPAEVMRELNLDFI